MTNKSRYFATVFEAVAFQSGLETASDGSIHHVEWKQLPPDNPTGMAHAVTWTDENSDARRLQQEPHKAMTPQEYVREHKCICPVCRGTDIDKHFPASIDGDQGLLEVSCNNPDCEASWDDIYELSGYELKD